MGEGGSGIGGVLGLDFLGVFCLGIKGEKYRVGFVQYWSFDWIGWVSDGRCHGSSIKTLGPGLALCTYVSRPVLTLSS